MGRKISDSSLKKIFPNKQIQKQRKAWEIKGDRIIIPTGIILLFSPDKACSICC